MPIEMEYIIKLSVFIAGMVGGVSALRRAIDKVSVNLLSTTKSLGELKSDVKDMKACDEDLKRHAAQMEVMMKAGDEFRTNVSRIHGDIYAKVNRLHERVQACETCNNFLKSDIERLKKQ